MILQIAIIVVVVCLIAIIINGVEDYNKVKAMVEVPFKDTMDRLKLPIVMLTNNNQQFNFLIDTGSTNSLIDTIVLDKLNHTKITGVQGSAYGINGEVIPVQYTRISLSYDSKEIGRAHV